MLATSLSFAFEVRPYGPASTPEEVQAIKDCIYVYRPGVVMYRELPIQSFFRQVRVWRIGHGTAEIHRWMIARNMLGQSSRD